MSEELIQRNLIEAPEKMGDWNFYNIGATTLKALKGAKIIPDKDDTLMQGKIGSGKVARPDFRYRIWLLKVCSIQMRSGLMISPNPI